MSKLKQSIVSFWNDEEGLGTLEILLIAGVLVAVAILFGNQIIEWVQSLISDIDPTIPSP